MIVKIAAWLYLIEAALSLMTLSLGGPFGPSGTAELGTLLFAGLYCVMGVGLLQLKDWARWLALGSSFLGWTLGTLGFIAVAGFVIALGKTGEFFALAFSSGPFGWIGKVLLLALILWVVGLVISFKLFWYLCSEEGCEEFGVPYGSASTVAASCASWIGIAIVQMFMSGGTSLLSLAAQSSARNSSESSRKERIQEHDRMQDELREQRRAAAQRAQVEAQEIRARNEAALARAAESESYSSAAQAAEVRPVEARAETPMTNQYPSQDKKDAEAPSAKRILKCRDASGAVTFTQAYCPAGTKQVEMPASE